MSYDDDSQPDHLDKAAALIECADNAVEYEEGSAYSLKAIAHVLLWQAEIGRNYKMAQDEWVRKQRENLPPPPPPFPTPLYGGF